MLVIQPQDLFIRLDLFVEFIYYLLNFVFWEIHLFRKIILLVASRLQRRAEHGITLNKTAEFIQTSSVINGPLPKTLISRRHWLEKKSKVRYAMI